MDRSLIDVFHSIDLCHVLEKGQPLPKFGEWDVNDPASAEGFTVIFNKARDEKKTGGKPESPTKANAAAAAKDGADPVKPPASSCSTDVEFILLAENMVLLHANPTCRTLTR
ncbi:hypothetical protein ACH5RR_038083 [Cinchona calisaya]|uniref:RIN4 pathogenic type III effector avirulence factor Avr cleavage site domain-containing protein n=1 Tax=Cinchona calisaya TaxID=153742 RepID=A0ABD2YBS2_9GENT